MNFFTGWCQAPASSTRSSESCASSEVDELNWVSVRCEACRARLVVPRHGHHLVRFTCSDCGACNDFSVSAPVAAASPASASPLSGALLRVTYPPYWTPSPDAGRAPTPGLFDEDDSVRAGLQALLHRTWLNKWTRDRHGRIWRYEVVAVQRNQNIDLWKGYHMTRALLATTGPMELYDAKTETLVQNFPEAKAVIERGGLLKEANEFYLFHGTSPSAAAAICSGGFLASKAGSRTGSLYGPGLYFAEASTKADEYATEAADGPYRGLFALLLCRVVCSNINCCFEADPPVQSLVDSIYRRGTHHSILGDREACRSSYREFVIFDKEQAYPEFVIVYKHVPPW